MLIEEKFSMSMLFDMGACYIICAKRYKKAEKSLKSYERALKRLENMYE